MKVFIIEDRDQRFWITAESQDQALDMVIARTGARREGYFVDEVDLTTAQIFDSEDILSR